MTHTTLRVTRIVIVCAVLAAALGLAIAHLTASGPRTCDVAGHQLANGTMIKVDQHGSAWAADSAVPGPVRVFTCVNGAWHAASPAGSVRTTALTRPATRPYWDGRDPATWTSETPPLCLARYHGRHGWIRPGSQGPRWRARCVPDGSVYAWGATPGGH